MYAYCYNNPVNYCDPTGESAAEMTLMWSSGAWWLTMLDGPFPIGDIVYLGVAAVFGFFTAYGLLHAADSDNNDSKKNDKDKKQPTVKNPEKLPPNIVVPDVDYPGDDPSVAPDGYDEWVGPDPKGGTRGGYKNSDPLKKDSWHPDLYHFGDVGPHWDYNDVFGHKWRIFPDYIEFVK